MALENILSQEIVQKLGWTLLHFIWQAAAVALLLGILLAVLRKSSANLRYIIACTALGLIVLLPIVTMQLVPVSVPQTTADIKPSPASVIVPVQPNEEALLARAIEYEEPTQLESVNSAPLASWKQRAVERLELALPYIVSAWLLGVFGLSLWHLGGWAQLQRLRKKMIRQVDDSLCVKLRRLSERLRVKRAVQLVESALVQVPTVVGWLRPVILLPASALTGLTTEQLEALLAHELAHIRRCDYLVNILQTIVETLGFYHPAVWWISQRIRVERENCCDDLAVSISGDLVCYARALTSMEEIRAGRNKLAVAAASGDLFGRIRRLVAKESSNSNQAGWIPAVITIMLIAIIAIPTTLALTGQSENKNDSNIETLLINGFRENKDKFKCGVLVWNLTEKHEGLSEGPRTETKGTFQLWWDDKKITTKYTQERTDLDANIVTDKREGGNVYDGKILSRKPRFETYENWFGGQLINWTGPRSVDQEIPALMKRRNVEMDFSTVVVDGKELLKLLSKNIDKATADYGAYTLRYFDPSKNYGLVKDEWYTSDNRLRLRFSYEIKDVIPDGWFPVEVDVKGFSLKDSKVYLQRHLGLDLERCKFNDPSAIPEGIFDFSASKEHEQLNDILEKLSDGMTADKSDNNSKSVRESVEGYIAAALAGEDEKAAKYAYPDTTVAAQTKDMREALKGQNIRIVGACIGEWNSLAISSVIQADHGRIGSVVFHLKKMVLDQKIHWLIDDIDLETLDTIGKQISYFLNNVPDAKTIIISADMYGNKQTDGQLKDVKGNIQPDKVVSNLVDPNSQPVAGAWVGTFVDFSDIAESPPIWFLTDGESYKASELESAAETESLMETDSSDESRQKQTPAPGVPVLAKSAEPSSADKSIVKVDLSVVEVSSDSKMDRETIVEIKNLLGGKITIPDSPDAADLLRKAAEATAEVKDESAGDKRVTQQQFDTLVDLLVSRSYVKILMNPRLQVVEGQTAQIKTDQNSLEVTANAVKDDIIYLTVKADLSSQIATEGEGKIPIISRRSFANFVRISSGQSQIIGGMIQPAARPNADGNAKESQTPARELMGIVTASIVAPAGNTTQPMETVNFQNAEAKTVIEKLAQWTGKTIIPTDELMKQKITIYSPEQMPRSEAAAMILNSLRSKGYTAEQTDETIFLKPATKEQPGIDKAQIMIETRILTVSEEFLKDIGLDANSISDANAISDPNAWPEPAPVVLAPPDNLGTYRLILDDLQVAFLLKAIKAHKDAKILISPRVTVWDGEKAEMFIGQETDFVSGYSEPNRPSDKPTPRIEKLKTGTSILLKPQLTPDKKNLYLDFESEIRELRGIEERKYKGKYPYQIPQVTVVNTKTSCLIPDGKTLLNCGQKITHEIESTSRVPILGGLPVVGGLFRSSSKITETQTLLILVKPSIDPQIKAPPEPQPLDPNDPLINPPEEKLNRADEQK